MGRNGLAQFWAENIRHSAANALARPGSYSAASDAACDTFL